VYVYAHISENYIVYISHVLSVSRIRKLWNFDSENIDELFFTFKSKYKQ